MKTGTFKPLLTLYAAGVCRLSAEASFSGWLSSGSALGAFLLIGTSRFPVTAKRNDVPRILQGVRDAVRMLRKRSVLRWLVLLELADLMMDILLRYLALYRVDVGGTTPELVGVGVAIWTGAGLAGGFLIIRLLKKVHGSRYLLFCAGIEMVLYTAFLPVPRIGLKLVLIGLIGLFNAGRYSILKASLYAEIADKSGTVMAVSSVSGLAGSLIPLGLGLAAEAFGLPAAMWLILIGPASLLIGLPKTGPVNGTDI